MPNKLYPHQQAEVDWFLRRGPSRAGLIRSQPGLGKSVTALAIAKALKAQRVLIISPSGLGLLPKAWLARCGEWVENASYGWIDAGPRASDSARAKCRKEILRSCTDYTVITPDLLRLVRDRQFDFIVIDEIHEYVNAKSAVAMEIKAIVQNNLGAARVGLTGTPLTADALNTWTTLDLLWPNQFGRMLATGKPPWAWQRRWGNEITSAHGTAYAGVKEEVREEFKVFLEQFSICTLREDLGGILPAVDIRIETIANDRDAIEYAVAKLDTISAESAHVGAYCHNIAPAQALFARLTALPRYRNHQIRLLTSAGAEGSHNDVGGGENRHETGQPRRNTPGVTPHQPSILVATMGAVGRGISLSYIQQYCVWQMVPTAHVLIQLDGRHVRLDKPGAPPAIGHLLFRAGADDAIRDKLSARLSEYTETMRAGRNVEDFRAAIAQGEASPAEMAALLGRSFRFLDVEDDDESDDLF